MLAQVCSPACHPDLHHGGYLLTDRLTAGKLGLTASLQGKAGAAVTFPAQSILAACGLRPSGMPHLYLWLSPFWG